MELSPQWLVNGGLRLDRYETKFTNTPANNYTVIKRNDTLWNYQLGLVYKPADNGSIYVSYATSSTPSNSDSGEGAGNGLAPGRGGAGANAADMAPEKNKTYELGTKWEVLDRRMTLTAAVFRTETTNARLTLPDNTYAMAGKKQVDGFELGFSGSITPAWQVFGGYTFLKSKIKDDGVATDKATTSPTHRATPSTSGAPTR